MASDWPRMERRGPPVTEENIATFEQRFGHTLPDDYRRFLLEVNGGRLAEDNTRFEDDTINSLFSLADKDHDSRDLETRARWAREMALVPHPDLLFIGNFDTGRILLMLSGSHRGELWSQDTVDPRPDDANPRVLWHDRRDMTKVTDSFEEFIRRLEPL
jgi:hypothetical protein